MNAAIRIILLTLLAAPLIVPAPATAQVPQPVTVPADLAGPTRGELTTRRQALVGEREALRARVKSHNAKCRGVEKGSAAAAECASAQPALNAAVQEYAAAVKAFNADVAAAIDWAISAAAAAEQDEFDRMNAAWLRKQEEMIRESVARNRAWTNEVLASIQAIRVPEAGPRPKTLRDLQPGDIVLMAPVGLSGAAIVGADRLTRAADLIAQGEIFRGIHTEREQVSHAVTVVKSVSGQLLFLDNTTNRFGNAFARKEGSHIITEREFLASYGGRVAFVAKPQALVDGRRLWEAAREAALQRKGDFGLVGDKVVCTERAGLAVARATGLPLIRDRLGPVDLTPGDFFDQQGVGKYFVVSPIAKPAKP